MRKFAKRLKELRKERGFSMEALSKATGIGEASISRWENGQSDISSDRLVQLSEFFGVTVIYLLGLED